MASGNKAQLEVGGWKLEQTQNPHPENRRHAAPGDITLSSLQRAAAMVGRRVMIELV